MDEEFDLQSFCIYILYSVYTVYIQNTEYSPYIQSQNQIQNVFPGYEMTALSRARILSREHVEQELDHKEGYRSA